MTLSIRTLLLAGVAALPLAACSGAPSSPGNTGSVTIGDNGGNTGAGADIDLVPSGSCTTGTTLETVTHNNGTVQACTITGTITQNLTLDPNTGYALEGAVFVGQDGGTGVALTVPAGTKIFGKSGEDYLVVSRGSRINVNGTATDPVIMTSVQDIQGTVNPATDRAQWGGLIINGKAPINDCIDANAAGGTAGCEKSGEGSSGLFGGDDPHDNSGTLSYLQVKYAGNLINDEDELNGIAFQAIGDGTTCDHIQVHNNADDGVEFFGGTVQCKYMVMTGIADDSFDYTDGFQGKIQYGLVLQGDDAGDRGLEADNRSSNNDKLPRSKPTMANFTFIGGPAGDTGMMLRAGTAGRFCNGIVVGWGDAGIDIDDAVTATQVTNGDLTLGSIFLDNNANLESDGDAGDVAEQTAFNAPGSNNVQGTNSLSNEVFPGANELAVKACDLSNDSFFDNVDYIGAFGPTETPDSNWAAGWTFGVFENPVECPSGTLGTGDSVNGKDICSITGKIGQNTRLNNNFIYQLDGAVFVGDDAGGDAANPDANARQVILTIDPGVTIFGRSGEDYLVINRGSQIRSNGTAANPVVMTSRDDVYGTADALTDRAKWGGLIINGRAKINDCIDANATGGTAGCEKSGEGSSGLFGGNDDTDNSGNILYTRVSYAGFLINDEDELNGIAFQGVGNGTTVDYVQVHNNADDGMEFFGGAVKVKHVVLTGNADDSLDWTDGWRGGAQYVIVQQAPDAGDRGFEGDNRSSNNDKLPRSMPTIANYTLLGGASGDTGMMTRAGTAGTFINGIVENFQDAGWDIDDAATAIQANQGDLSLYSVFLADNKDNLESDGDNGDAAETAAFNAAGHNNVDGNAQNPALTGTMNGFVPGANEQSMTPTDPKSLNSDFDTTDYVGAVKDANDTWYEGWTFIPDYN